MNDITGWPGQSALCGWEKPKCATPCGPSCTPQNLPKFACCGQETVRCAPVRFSVSGLPCGLLPPFALVSLEAAPENAQVCIREQGICGAVADVKIPLTACVRDRDCRIHRGCTEITMTVRLSNQCACRGGSFLASTDIRLIDACPAVCEPVFDAQVAARVEVFLVRLDRCGQSACWPFFGRPFFPQPNHHSFF